MGGAFVQVQSGLREGEKMFGSPDGRIVGGLDRVGSNGGLRRAEETSQGKKR